MSDQANSPAAAQAQPAAPKASRKTRLAVAAIVFLALAAGYGAYYMGYGQYSESTDDAYVGANLVYVQAQAPGTVIALGADDNQPVQLGQTLVKLDGADASVALADAEARLGETVRIALDPGELQKNPLRVGLSSVVEIDTHDRNGRADTAESLPNATLSTPVFDGLLAKAEAQADAVVARESGAGQ